MAPFFSGVASNSQGEARYLILAQSLLADRYTLREGFANGSHGSLGDGPEPSLENFLTAFLRNPSFARCSLRMIRVSQILAALGT